MNSPRVKLRAIFFNITHHIMANSLFDKGQAAQGLTGGYLGKNDKYKYVYNTRQGGRLKFNGSVSRAGIRYAKLFDTEREAALYVDSALIKCGCEPVNILKRL